MTPNEVLFYHSTPDKVMPIYYLWRAVWRFVFDENGCPPHHRSEVEKEIMKWNNIVQYQKKIRYEKFGPNWQNSNPVGQKGNPIDEIEFQVGMMCKTLVEKESGYWDYHRDTLKIHGIDYRKSIHCNEWFPDFQDPDRFERGQHNLKQAMKDNPEDYMTDKKIEDK